ncbi:MAG: hypothetical protein WKF82_13525 [Nocardioidaceae bacterium]
MRARQAIGIGLVAALTAGAAWFGLGAATAGSEQVAGNRDRAEFRGWSGVPVKSMARAKRIAAVSGNNTLLLVTRENRARMVDVGRQGFSTGDFFVFEETVYGARGRRVIGEDTVRCESGIRAFTCEATIRLDGRGKITVAGSFFARRDNVLPVTGGTQRFSGVDGQLKVFDLPRGRSLLAFELMR